MRYIIELNTSERDIICSLIRAIRDNILGEDRLFEDTKLFKFDEESTDYDAVYRKGIEDGNKIADKDLKEIQESTYDVAYNKALKDVNHAMDVLADMTVAEVKEWFKNCIGIDDVVCDFTVQRIVEIINAYEENKKAEEEIRVGDVVITRGGNIAVVTKVEDNCVRVMFKDGSGFRDVHTVSELEKTSMHFNEVEQLLNKLRGEEE